MTQRVSSPDIEAHLGDVSGQVAIGDYNVQIHAEQGAIVNFAPADNRPVPALRPSPIQLKPRRITGLLDRDAEIRTAADAIRTSRPVQFRGETGIGKTALLRQLAYAEDITRAGVADFIYILARQQLMQDLAQSLFEAFYETGSPFKPTDAQLRLLLQDRRATVLLDDVELDRDDVEALMDIAPQCAFVVASTQRRMWGDICDLSVGGLPTEHGLALVERELGHPLSEEERRQAAMLCQSKGGNPLLIMQAVASARDDRKTLAQLIEPAAAEPVEISSAGPDLGNLTEPEKRLLIALAALGGLPVATGHLAPIAEVPDPDPLLNDLIRRNLVQVENSDYSLAPNLTDLASRNWDLTAMKNRAIDYFVGLADQSRKSPSLSSDEVTLMLLLEKEAAAAGRWPEAGRLAEGIDASLAVSGKWGAWDKALTTAQKAAEACGEKKLEGWALHQRGTRALCLGDKPGARSLLTRALEIREANGDHLGALATRHNLQILVTPTPPPDGKGSAGRRGFGRRVFKPILLALVFLAVVVPLVWLLGPRPDRNPAISPEPGELDFGNQAVQTSSEGRTITLTNTGSAALVVSSVTLSGASAADYAVEREDCTQAPIAPGSSCVIEVGFKPTTAGPLKASLQVVSKAGGPGLAIPISGIGTAGEISYEPNALNFDELEIGAGGQARKVTLHNGGLSDFAIAGLAVMPATDKPEFNIVAENCSGSPIPPGGDCSVTVAFSPIQAGDQVASLRVIDSTGVNYVVPLSGKGRPPELAGYCCSNGAVSKATKRDCQSIRGYFAESLEDATHNCQPQPTPKPSSLPTPLPTPLSGYCCKDGTVTKAYSDECKANGGVFSQDLAGLRRDCSPPSPTPSPPPAQSGYCCKDGKISKMAAGDCKNIGGLFSQNLVNARRYCQPPPTPRPTLPPLSGYCCKDGRISKTSSDECKATGGAFTQSLAAVRQFCQPPLPPPPAPTPLRGYCCQDGRISKATAGECRGIGGLFSQNLAALRRFCQQPTPPPPPPSDGYCCRGGKISRATASECKGSGGAFSQNLAALRRYCVALPTPTPTPAPQSGYCCRDGRILKSTAIECRSGGGFFSPNLGAVRRYCRPASSPTPTPVPQNGWCCVNGQVTGLARQDCAKQHGAFYRTKREADQKCNQPILR